MAAYVRRIMTWRRTVLWAGILTSIVMLPLIAGCGDEASGVQSTATLTAPATDTPTAPPTATATVAPTNSSVETPSSRDPSEVAPRGPSADIAPPLAVLTAGAGTQEAGLGTYCWQDAEQGLCVDFVGLPVPEVAVTANRGERLTISVPGIEQLVNVHLEAYDYAHSELDGDTRMILYPPPEPIEVPYEDDGTTVTVTADLPAGQYVISLFVGFPAEPLATTVRGDAMYGFHIEVVD